MTVHGGPHDRAPITKLSAVSGINPGSMVGAVLDGRYRVTERIARGGMATVYRGTDLRLDRPIAVKMLDLGLFAASDLAGKLADAIAADLQREAKTIARLSHPNVVAVFDHGVHAGHPYLVMEYVPGRTLRGLLTERPVLDPVTALGLFEPVLAALAAAHRAGVVHRDMKPENVLIGDGVVKVADFGLARAVKATHQATDGNLLATPGYVSPELVREGRTDVRSDVYSAGIMLFELVTGRLPYRSDSALTVARDHVERDVPAPSSLVPDLPAGLDELVLRATRRDPGARFAEAGEFLTALRSERRSLLTGVRDSDPDRADDAATVPIGEIAGSVTARLAWHQRWDRIRRQKSVLVAAAGCVVATAVLVVGSMLVPTQQEQGAADASQTSPSATPSATPRKPPGPDHSQAVARTPTRPARTPAAKPPTRSRQPTATPDPSNSCPPEFSDEWWYEYCS